MERGFALTVILILALAMFAGFFPTKSPTGMAFQPTLGTNLPDCTCAPQIVDECIVKNIKGSGCKKFIRKEYDCKGSDGSDGTTNCKPSDTLGVAMNPGNKRLNRFLIKDGATKTGNLVLTSIYLAKDKINNNPQTITGHSTYGTGATEGLWDTSTKNGPFGYLNFIWTIPCIVVTAPVDFAVEKLVDIEDDEDEEEVDDGLCIKCDESVKITKEDCPPGSKVPLKWKMTHIEDCDECAKKNKKEQPKDYPKAHTEHYEEWNCATGKKTEDSTISYIETAPGVYPDSNFIIPSYAKQEGFMPDLGSLGRT
jgi:hypothetical protein